MLGKVCHSMLGISKSNFSTRLELENIILSKNNYSMCCHCIFSDFKVQFMVELEAITLPNMYIPSVFS